MSTTTTLDLFIVLKHGTFVPMQLPEENWPKMKEVLVNAVRTQDGWVMSDTAAVFAPEIAGWYVTKRGITPSERTAQAIEKLAESESRGEGWKQ